MMEGTHDRSLRLRPRGCGRVLRAPSASATTNRVLESIRIIPSLVFEVQSERERLSGTLDSVQDGAGETGCSARRATPQEVKAWQLLKKMSETGERETSGGKIGERP